uniref:Mitochondrial import inner membrane translocase subunit n=1 Tax=Globisporangium ultimum (strain ATCC 200006 / CBS 805.95 / DAOM BR144) TaxID=431595 RepID=K3WYE9_GLOUD
MSFFGFGKSKAPEPETHSYGSYEEPTYDYSSSPSSFDSAPVSSAPSAGSFGASDMQNLLVEEQQRALIQQAISKITAIAWDKCSASKPDSELSSKETDCIKNVTLAYIDSSAFVVHRLNKST